MDKTLDETVEYIPQGTIVRDITMTGIFWKWHSTRNSDIHWRYTSNDGAVIQTTWTDVQVWQMVEKKQVEFLYIPPAPAPDDD